MVKIRCTSCFGTGTMEWDGEDTLCRKCKGRKYLICDELQDWHTEYVDPRVAHAKAVDEAVEAVREAALEWCIYEGDAADNALALFDTALEKLADLAKQGPGGS